MGKRKPLLGFLGSLKMAVYLMATLAFLAANGTFIPPEQGEKLYRLWLGDRLLPVARILGLVDAYRSPLFLSVVFLLAANIIWCTLRRTASRKRGTIGWGSPAFSLWLDVLLHSSLIVILLGGVAKGLWGFVGTQYLFTGEPADTVYDLRAKRDAPLGFALLLREKREEFYPLRIRLGVSSVVTGGKLALLEMQEGKEAAVGSTGIRLAVGGLMPGGGGVRLVARRGGREERVELKISEGGSAVILGEYRLTLVGFRRDLRMVSGLVALYEGGREVKAGWLKTNSPVKWHGTSIFLVGWGADDGGREFLGIQASRDPGAPLFWVGALFFCLTLPLFMLARQAVRKGEKE